jgi:zinc transporter 10
MSGLSTSVAVLCHELPHEIGDFAMLLKAGMTVKQAVFYNVLSSVLALVGMVGGLLLAASLPSVTPWLFAATAGIFLYVALVDMMPELSSGHAHPISQHGQQEARGLALALQVLGMATGLGIMLLIALYEHDLKVAFGGREEAAH